MNFIVVHATTEAVDPEGHYEGSIDEEDAYMAEVKDLILCKDKVDVEMALEKAEKAGYEWAVYEILDKPVGKKPVRRTIVFEKDGTTIKRFE